jgi:thioredoxin 1
MYELMDFYSKGCIPCKVIAPKLDKFAEEKNIKLNKIEVYDNMDKAEKYGVSSAPTLILLKENKEIFRANGINSINELQEKWSLLVS